MKKYLILILLLIINYNLSAQDYVAMHYIGIQNKSYPILIIENGKTPLTLDSSFGVLGRRLSYTANLSQEEYKIFLKIIRKKGFLQDEECSSCGFEIDFHKQSKIIRYYLPDSKCISFFNKSIEEMEKNNMNAELIFMFKDMLRRLDPQVQPDCITIEHIGITNKPFTKLIVKDSQTVVDIPFRLKIPYPITVINLGKDMYIKFGQILKNKLNTSIDPSWNFGTFEIVITENNKTEKYYSITIENSIVFFTSIITELKSNKMSKDLINELESIVYRLDLNKKAGWSQ